MVQGNSKPFIVKFLSLANQHWMPGTDALIVALSIRFKRLKFPRAWRLTWKALTHMMAVGGVMAAKFYLGLLARDPSKSHLASCKVSVVQHFVGGI